MKKVLIILLFILIGLTVCAQWQPSKGIQITYQEPYTGTIISLTKTHLDLYVNTDYTYITEPTGFELVVYDSIGHFVERFVQDYPNIQAGICRKIYNYSVDLNGTIDITIYGNMNYQQGTTSYTIEIPTHRRQKLYEEWLKQMLR